MVSEISLGSTCSQIGINCARNNKESILNQAGVRNQENLNWVLIQVQLSHVKLVLVMLIWCEWVSIINEGQLGVSNAI